YQLLLQEMAVEPDRRNQQVPCRDAARETRLAAPVTLERRDAHDLPPNRRLLPVLHIGQLAHAIILVAKREIAEQVGDGCNAKGVKRLFLLRAHAFDRAYR